MTIHFYNNTIFSNPYFVVFIAIIIIIFLIFILIRIAFPRPKQSSHTNIPMKIHQTWHTKNLPLKMKECVENLKRENPEFEHYLYDDEECRQFIVENFDESVVDAYDRLIPGTFKADLWRYCLLYKKGGVYLDIKFQCENGFKFADLINLNNNSFFAREYLGVQTNISSEVVYTGFMITQPNNELFLKCIRKICENVASKYYGTQHTEPTGPFLVGSFFTSQQKSDMEYAYYEKEGIGYISNIKTHRNILSHYSEYRDEQRNYGKTGYWKDLWNRREIYL